MTVSEPLHPTVPQQGALIIRGYRLVRRAKTWAFTRLVRRGFAEFGSSSSITAPAGISGAAHVAVGRGTAIGANSVLRVLGTPKPGEVKIRLGDGVSIVGGCTISAYELVDVGSGVMFARNVYIADHAHAYEDSRFYVKDQGINRVAPVRIGAGSWLAENVVVLPGVTIGEGAVVGANSVVRDDVPPFSAAVGAPARVVKSWDPSTKRSTMPDSS